MKPTETPAYRPTASSIWNAFLSSHKRHLILTGMYMEESLSGLRTQIGVCDPARPGLENQMRVCCDESAWPAVSLFRKLAERAEPWVFADEIGCPESGSEPCMNVLRTLLDQKRVIAAVRKQDIPILLELRKRPDVFCVDLDAPFGNTGCVIMASGLSKRFGGNKLLADFHGAPLITRILTVTEGIFARRVVVTRHPAIADICRDRGIEAILHALPLRSDTVRLGLEAIGDADGCMFCAADQPLLKQETIAALVLSAVDDQGSIWRPCFGEEHGSPVLFPRWTFEQLLHLPAGKGGGVIARQHPDRVRTIPVRNRFELMDADDRETLELLWNMESES